MFLSLILELIDIQSNSILDKTWLSIICKSIGKNNIKNFIWKIGIFSKTYKLMLLICFLRMLAMLRFACVQAQSCRLFTTPRTVAHQAPLFIGFSRQEHWSRLPFPLPGGLSDPEIKPVLVLLAASALVGGFFTTEPSEKLKQWKTAMGSTLIETTHPGQAP